MTADPAGRVDIADLLWSSDVAGALTNEAAREIERLRTALRSIVYETTYLSPAEDDGSHWCRISRETLAAARAALAPAEGEKG